MIPTRLESLLRADSIAVQLAQLFATAGHEIYLVGGSVRDAMLGRTSGDLDFTTGARPDEIKRLVASWADDVYTMGEAFGTIGAIRDGEVAEITTFRSEMYLNESRKPQVSFSDDLGEDLSRRDFTINSMALGVPLSPTDTPVMIDPYGGLADLAIQVLRTPLDPHVSFGDDPLRMLRLFRFVSVLGFTPDAAAVEAVREMAGRLAIVSGERIRDEFVKLMVGDNVGDALRGLIETRLIDQFVPELIELGMQQDPVHQHKDVLAHTVAVVEKTSPRPTLRLAALFHDIGKPETREFGPDGVSFHHHEVVGARMTRARMRELKFPKDTVKDVAQLVFLHMRPHTLKMGWTDRAVRRYVRDADTLLEDLNELVRCDVTTRNERRARTISRRIDELERRIVELAEQEELNQLRPPVDGHEVMEYLGMAPGPQIGKVMSMLMEHRIDHGPYTQAEAFALIDTWMAEQD